MPARPLFRLSLIHILEDLSFVGNNEFEAADSAARFIAAKGYHSLHFVFPGFEGKEADFYGGHRERLNGAQAVI